MKRILTVSSLLVIVLSSLTIGTHSYLFRTQASAPQDQDLKEEEAKVHLLAATREGYSKHRLTNALADQSVSFTLATQRLSNSRSALAIAVHVNDSELLTGKLDLKLTYQPVEVADNQVVQKIGLPAKGIFQIGKRGNNNSDNAALEFSYPLTAPEQANALSVEIHLIAKGKDYGLTFIKGMTGEVSVGTVERSTVGGTAVDMGTASINGKRDLFSAHRSNPQYGCCSVRITVTCGNCSVNATCNVCGGNPIVTCQCDNQGSCSCGINCGTPTGCH